MRVILKFSLNSYRYHSSNNQDHENRYALLTVAEEGVYFVETRREDWGRCCNSLRLQVFQILSLTWTAFITNYTYAYIHKINIYIYIYGHWPRRVRVHGVIPRRKADHLVTEETPGTCQDFRSVPCRSICILQVATALRLNTQLQHPWTGVDDQSPPEPENRVQVNACSVPSVEIKLRRQRCADVEVWA